MTNKQFRKELLKWAIELKLNNFYFCRDDRIDYAACVGQMQDGKPYLEYSLRNINAYGRYYHSILFHEFGHIIYKHYKENEKSLERRVEVEYQAENFSFKMMKKYFPKQIDKIKKKQIEMLENVEWADRWPIHAEAFKRVYKRK